MAGACKKNEAKGETSKPLGVLNFTSAFILLTSGMLLSVALLLLEHLYFAFFRAKLRKCDTVGCCSLVSLVSTAENLYSPYNGRYKKREKYKKRNIEKNNTTSTCHKLKLKSKLNKS